jgi:hypothetical protein
MHHYWVLVYQTTPNTTYPSGKNMLYATIIINKHCKKMGHSYKKHLHDHENKNVMFIHMSKNISVIILG